MLDQHYLFTTTRLVARGKSNKEIANEMCISEATVNTHVINLHVKLGVNDRTRAVISALLRGIISLE